MPGLMIFRSPGKPELGTIWGLTRRQVRAQRGSGGRDGLVVRVQIALRGDQRAVPGDLPEHVDWDSRIGHPGQACMPKIVPSLMLVAELVDDFVPVRRVAQDRRGDPAVARAGEDACLRIVA